MMEKMRNQRFFVGVCFLSILIFNIFALGINSIFIQSRNTKNSSVLRTSIGEQDYWPTDGWLTTSPEEQDMDHNTLSKMYDYIENNEFNIHSVIVVRNGYIIEEEYLNYFKIRAVKEDYSEEMHILHSVTKSLTSLCIGMALTMGYIDNLSQTFFEFFPELWKPSYDIRKKNITIAHLLTMTSGIEWDEWSLPYESPGNDNYEMFSTYDCFSHKNTNLVL